MKYIPCKTNHKILIKSNWVVAQVYDFVDVG